MGQLKTRTAVSRMEGYTDAGRRFSTPSEQRHTHGCVFLKMVRFWWPFRAGEACSVSTETMCKRQNSLDEYSKLAHVKHTDTITSDEQNGVSKVGF